jgi:rSAM/selenodomain-associated transferase 1
VVLVFLKAPRPGHAKTRLAASVGSRSALELHRAFAGDLLEWLADLRGVERRVVFDPPDGLEECARLVPATRQKRFLWEPQARGGLGNRLSASFSGAFREGARRVIAIGADAPLLGPRILRRALAMLARRDAVVGPAWDGGYYLLGLRRDSPRLFEGIPWSTAGVLEATLRRIDAARLTRGLLPVLGDVDTGADLERLREGILDRWRRPGREPFPLRTFRALCWPPRQPPGRR